MKRAHAIELQELIHARDEAERRAEGLESRLEEIEEARALSQAQKQEEEKRLESAKRVLEMRREEMRRDAAEREMRESMEREGLRSEARREQPLKSRDANVLDDTAAVFYSEASGKASFPGFRDRNRLSSVLPQDSLAASQVN